MISHPSPLRPYQADAFLVRQVVSIPLMHLGVSYDCRQHASTFVEQPEVVSSKMTTRLKLFDAQTLFIQKRNLVPRVLDQ
jgi:hypothetical protein